MYREIYDVQLRDQEDLAKADQPTLQPGATE